MPTFESARFNTSLTPAISYPICAKVSSPIFVSFSDSASSMPTRQMSDERSTAAITSGVKAGGVSTITTSWRDRSASKTARKNGIVIAAAWSGRTGASSACAPDG